MLVREDVRRQVIRQAAGIEQQGGGQPLVEGLGRIKPDGFAGRMAEQLPLPASWGKRPL